MNYKKWKQINDEGYDSNVIDILEFLKNEEELEQEHPKTQAILSLMERKNLIVGDKLTVLGEELLKNIELVELIPIKVKKNDKFTDWWESYPATDAFKLDGRVFAGTQSKRIKKDECKKLFDKIVNSGISADDIINATKYHILQAKKLSLTRGTSQLAYIGNSKRYLAESMFEPYIEMSKEQTKEVEFKSNVL